MNQRSATEFTSKFATTVDDLTEAWAFVMAHMDEVGSDPVIRITPYWTSDDDFTGRYFEVSVSGMVERKKYNENGER